MSVPTIASLNNAAIDLAHIEDLATSLDATATDRLGNVKMTVSAAVNSIRAFNSRGAWVTAAAYAVRDLVSVSGEWYACVTAHTSSALFATDEATKWRVHQGITSTELGANNQAEGSALVTQPTEYADEQATSVFSIMRGRAHLKRFWVSGDGLDWTNAINKMINSGARNLILPGDVDIRSNGGHLILDQQDLHLDNARVTSTDDSQTLFTASSKEYWGIRGRGTLVGSLVTAESQPETGLHIISGRRYVVDGLTITNFKGRGLYLSGTGVGVGGLRGDRGQFSNVSTHNCTLGLEIGAGAGSEYNTWTNYNASGNTLAMLQDAGNNTFSGGNIVDNLNGMKLVGVGGNHAHGMVTGMNINHNTNFNLHCQNVLNGHTLAANHFYGNANGTSQGFVWLENCKGVNIVDGVIDTWVYNDSGAGSGFNRIAGNYFPTGATNTQFLSNNGALGQLMIADNWDADGPSAFNDRAAVFVSAIRGGSTQALSSGSNVTVICNSENIDNRGAYNTSTGVFTAPVLGTYRFTVNLSISGSSLTGAYGSFRLNAATTNVLLAYAKSSIIGGAVVVLGDTIDVSMAAGDTLEFTANVTGTSPVVDVGNSSISIALVR